MIQFTPSAGCLVSKSSVEKNKRLIIKDVISKGATIIYRDIRSGYNAKMAPIIVKGTTKDIELYYTESFSLMVSSVKSNKEALVVANDTEYRLSATVFTKDLGRGLRFVREVKSRAVHINGMTVHDETALPHGGE
jgi:acyl-CoA reductase-like NAD-dependent aldehyde dehydrogenase